MCFSIFGRFSLELDLLVVTVQVSTARSPQISRQNIKVLSSNPFYELIVTFGPRPCQRRSEPAALKGPPPYAPKSRTATLWHHDPPVAPGPRARKLGATLRVGPARADLTNQALSPARLCRHQRQPSRRAQDQADVAARAAATP